MTRKAFEAWATADFSLKLSGGGYLSTDTQKAWAVWQAAIKHEREACLAVCEEISAQHRVRYRGHSDPMDCGALFDPHVAGMADGAHDCSDAIRARTEGLG